MWEYECLYPSMVHSQYNEFNPLRDSHSGTKLKPGISIRKYKTPSHSRGRQTTPQGDCRFYPPKNFHIYNPISLLYWKIVLQNILFCTWTMLQHKGHFVRVSSVTTRFKWVYLIMRLEEPHTPFWESMRHNRLFSTPFIVEFS